MRGPTIMSTIIVLIILLVISWLNYWFISRWLPAYRQRFIKISYWLLTAATVSVTVYMRIIRPAAEVFSRDWFQLLIYITFGWMVGQLILLILLPVLYGSVKLFNRQARLPAEAPEAPPRISRRTFLKNALAAVPAIAFGTGIHGVYSGNTDIAVYRYPLSLPGFPPALSGFRIVQISDTHIGPFFTLPKLDQALALVSRETPDLVVITGDLIDDLELLEPTVSKLNELADSIPYGIYYCLGNHEYFRNIQKVRAAIGNSRVNMLVNSNSLIISGQPPVFLVGVDYPWSKNPPEQRSIRQRFVEKASANIPREAFRILLAHHPDFLFDGFSQSIPLTLAGHTHGGQVVLFDRPIFPLPYAFMRGFYQKNRCYGYVSSGTGHWLPFRLNCPAEITVFNLFSS